jgi:hypothetical protein
MTAQTPAERTRRYRQRQRNDAERHDGKVPLRNVYVTSAAQAMLALLAEQYGDASGVIEEAICRLHAAHYRSVTDNVTVTARSDRPKPAPRMQEPGKPARRAALVRRIKALHDEGLGATAIAARLNREGEATLSGVGQWRHKAVQALLNEAE